ncbi:hypothetical protein Ancab_029902 [Ancistrocladus abbreviatus]
MAATTENQLVGQLKDAGSRLLHPPSSSDEMLNLLDEVELLLSTVGQSPAPLVQEALLPAMKALVSDQFLRNPDMDVKITVAACLNEIMRITAPDAPYNDGRMKEIFELVVASFDKLSLVSGRSYTKAVSIIDNVAKVRSCVMMLDLECDALIVEMFEQFQKNIRSNHPHTVFLAMETIMTLIIEESEDISLKLLKVLLSSVRKGNQNASPMSWKLGAKVIEKNAQKLKAYVMAAIKSMDINKDDYDPIVASICQHQDDAMEQHPGDDSGEQGLPEELAAIATSPGKVGDLGDMSKPDLSPQAQMAESDISVKEKNSKALGHGMQTEKLNSADSKARAEEEIESRKNYSKSTRKPNCSNPDEGYDNPSISRGKGQSLASPRGLHGKASAMLNTTGKRAPASGDVVPKKELGDAREIRHPVASGESRHRNKKQGKRKAKSEESGEKRVPSRSAGKSSKKDEEQVDGTSKKLSQKKRILVTDEVFETPHGKKYYKEDIVGCRVKVWWPYDRAFYEGVVAAFNPEKMTHRVNYDDGDVETLNLRKEIWEFIGDEDLPDNGEEDGDQVAHASPHLVQRGTTAKAHMDSPQSITRNRGAVSQSGAKSNDKKLKGAGDSRKDGAVNPKEPEVRSDTKRRRLIKGQKS